MLSNPTRQSRKAKRKAKNQEQRSANTQGCVKNFELVDVQAKTDNQRIAFDSYNAGKNLMLHGIAGTGKTFLSLFLSLEEVLSEGSLYKKVYIIRSVVPTRDMGFLPGNTKEKTKVYEAPYYAICTELFGRSDSYEYLKTRGLVEFISTSFIRGITLNDCIVIVDECQNLDWGELTSVITRVGKNCRIIYSGDYRQSDFRFREKDSKNDVMKFMSVLKNIHEFAFINFTAEDIVRSDLVKKFIIAVDKMGLDL